MKNFRTRYQSLAMVLVLENKRSSTSTAERPIVDDAKKVEPLKVGNSIPALTLKNSQDEKVSLSSLHADGPVVIMFFRSSWCPFCTRHTQELIKAMPKIKELGAQLVAISPDNVESSKGNVEKNAIPFPVLSDSNVAAARALGWHSKSMIQRSRYKGFGIDLNKASGLDHHALPVPAVFIVDKAGKIAYTHSDPDYKKRLDVKTIVEELKKLKSF